MPRITRYVLFLSLLLIWVNQDVSRRAYAQTSPSTQEAKAHFQSGLQRALQGELDQAVNEFNTAITLDPSNPFFYYNLGLVLGMKREFQPAMEAFTHTLRIRPDHLQSHFRLGLLYEIEGRYEKALEEYQRVIGFGEQEWEVAMARQRITLLEKALSDLQ